MLCIVSLRYTFSSSMLIVTIMLIRFFSEDKEALEKAVDAAIEWLDHNQLAEVDEIEHQRTELEGVCNPIVTKLYQVCGDSLTVLQTSKTFEFGGSRLVSLVLYFSYCPMFLCRVVLLQVACLTWAQRQLALPLRVVAVLVPRLRRWTNCASSWETGGQFFLALVSAVALNCLVPSLLLFS